MGGGIAIADAQIPNSNTYFWCTIMTIHSKHKGVVTQCSHVVQHHPSAGTVSQLCQLAVLIHYFKSVPIVNGAPDMS